MAHDLVIRGGTVVDGSGQSGYVADIGISGDKITEIGKITKNGTREIDAEGHVVSPGFIDAHTHFDAQVNWDPLGTSSCWHGVTSVVMGNCGFTLAPCKKDERALVVRNLEKAEDISAAAMAIGIDWNWETFPEYLDSLSKLPKAFNCAAYVGHSALRTWAMGERAFEHEADDDELKLMQAQLADAVRAGAIGFSTSRTVSHETSDNRPVASRLASWDEVRALVGTMGTMGKGIFEIANGTASRSLDPEIRGRNHKQLMDLALESKVPVTFGINRLASVKGDDAALNPNPPREVWRDFLKLVDGTNRAGGTMFGQTNCKDINVLLSFRTQLPFDKLPIWKELRAQPLAEQARLLRNPEFKAKLVETANNGSYGRAIGNEARRPNWDMIQYFDKPLPPHKVMSALARERGVDPVTLLIDLSLETDFNCFFMQFPTIDDPDGLLEIMRHPSTVMTFSNSGAHVGQISDCSIQSYLLAHWVRDRGALKLEEAINMMTHRLARYWGFADRGLLQPGLAADINVFDPERVTPRLPSVVHDLPGGARRMIQKSDGFKATIVAGQVVLDNGEHTGALPGRVLRQN